MIVAFTTSSDAGPGERDELLRRASATFTQHGVDDVARFDVTKGSTEDGDLRGDIEGLIPAFQSDSLFGGARGVLIVDAHNLSAAESEIVAGLVSAHGAEDGLVAVVVAMGALKKPLAAALKDVGNVTVVKKLRESDIPGWITHAARERKMMLSPDAVGALVQSFGTDVASIGNALDQLAVLERRIEASDVTERFRNRPDEPMWHYADAVAAGDVAEALRRLADFLTHGHQLQLLGFLVSDLRRRAVAAAAPDLATLHEWMGTRQGHYPTEKAWRARGNASESELHRALEALARADLHLKTAPEATHRITMERLTVALCRWYGGSARRAG